MLLASYSGVANTEVAVLAAATIGACLGFLGFNAYPARIFMGDTGSMALGGAVVAFAILTNSVLFNTISWRYILCRSYISYTSSSII